MNPRSTTLVTILAASLINVTSASASTPAHLWSKSFGTTRWDEGYSVAVDGSGNVFVTGALEGTKDALGRNISDIVLAKYDASGTLLWSKRFGSTGDDNGSSVAVDGSGNVLVAGSFEGMVDFGGGNWVSVGSTDIFLAKYSAGGTHLWSRHLAGAGSDTGSSIAVDESGSVLVTGWFYGTLYFEGGNLVSAGGSDIFVAKYDASGARQWIQRFGGTSFEGGHAVAVDGSGNVLVTGFFNGTVNFGGDDLVSAGQNDIFVTKFDGSMNHLWSHRFGDFLGDEGRSVAVDASGNVLVTGSFFGTVDFGGGNLVGGESPTIFVAKFDAGGTHQWSQSFGSTGGDYGYSVAADGPGNVLVTGFFEETIDFGGGDRGGAGKTIFVAKFDASGAHMWSQGFGGPLCCDSGYSVAADGLGNAFVTGSFIGTVDFGGGDLGDAGSGDIFLVKYADSPTTAVAITSFEAMAHDGVIKLHAAFRSDLGVEVVNVYRGEGESGLSHIESLTGVAPDRFEYLDRGVTPGAMYRYQIGVVDGDGEFLSPIVRVSVDALATRLEQNAPNPFNPGTSIAFALSERTPVRLSIYDAAGARVRVLLDAVREPGTHRVEWDGRDDRGSPMSSGVYFYRLHAGKFTESKKMVLVK